MKVIARSLIVLLFGATMFVHAQISSFQHIIIVFQENRTPDNLFYSLCMPPYGKPSSCSTKPTGSQYNIQTKDWLDKNSSTGTTQPLPVALANTYDVGHGKLQFDQMCDWDSTAGVCKMDGAGDIVCGYGKCPTKPQFKYVDNSTGILNPYLDLATQYGWANYMFQTNQGPSFPAHQFIFGGTSAPSAADDAIGTYASENVYQPGGGKVINGCLALAGSTVQLITPQGETQEIYPCFEHQTLADLLDAINVSWKYYTIGTTNLWTAPNAIQHICVPNAPTGGSCAGADWNNSVVVGSSKVLTDITKCQLSQVSWVIPDGKNSDHASSNDGGGPSWVASIVNAVGKNPKCADGELYWDNTAILVTWDDWGGWYDHEPPTILAQPYGDYQYGFRVPLLVISAYTAPRVDNNRYDFGSILRFVERNFGIVEGSLDFADARTETDLAPFFNLNALPRSFRTITSALDANYFINDTSPPTDPDND